MIPLCNPKLTNLLSRLPPAALTYIMDRDNHLGAVDRDPRAVRIPYFRGWQNLSTWATELRQHAVREGLELAVYSRIDDPDRDPAYMYLARLADNILRVLTPSDAEVVKVRGMHHLDLCSLSRRGEGNTAPWLQRGDILYVPSP